MGVFILEVVNGVMARNGRADTWPISAQLHLVDLPSRAIYTTPKVYACLCKTGMMGTNPKSPFVCLFLCVCMCVCVCVCCAGFLLKCRQKQEGLYRKSLSFSKPKHYEIILIKKGKISNNCKYYKSCKL